MAIPDQRLLKFCHRALGEVLERGQVTRVELLHSSGDGRDLLDTLDVPEEGDPKDFAQEIFDVAFAHAETMAGTVQRYTCLAYFNDEPRHAYQVAFICNSRGMLLEGEEHTEPANLKGTLAHFMRHNENNHKLLVGSLGEIIGSLKSSLREETDQRRALQDQVDRTFILNQQLLDRSQDREIERAKAARRDQRMDQLLGTAMNVLPALLQRMSTPSDVPSGGSPLEEATKDLLCNLSAEEHTALLEVVSSKTRPETQARFKKLYVTIQSAEEAPPVGEQN